MQVGLCHLINTIDLLPLVAVCVCVSVCLSVSVYIYMCVCECVCVCGGGGGGGECVTDVSFSSADEGKVCR